MRPDTRLHPTSRRTSNRPLQRGSHPHRIFVPFPAFYNRLPAHGWGFADMPLTIPSSMWQGIRSDSGGQLRLSGPKPLSNEAKKERFPCKFPQNRESRRRDGFALDCDARHFIGTTEFSHFDPTPDGDVAGTGDRPWPKSDVLLVGCEAEERTKRSRASLGHSAGAAL